MNGEVRPIWSKSPAGHRNGPIGTAHLTFLARFAKFEDGAKNI